jgi:hypothetical protein
MTKLTIKLVPNSLLIMLYTNTMCLKKHAIALFEIHFAQDVPKRKTLPPRGPPGGKGGGGGETALIDSPTHISYRPPTSPFILIAPGCVKPTKPIRPEPGSLLDTDSTSVRRPAVRGFLLTGNGPLVDEMTTGPTLQPHCWWANVAGFRLRGSAPLRSPLPSSPATTLASPSAIPLSPAGRWPPPAGAPHKTPSPLTGRDPPPHPPSPLRCRPRARGGRRRQNGRRLMLPRKRPPHGRPLPF